MNKKIVGGVLILLLIVGGLWFFFATNEPAVPLETRLSQAEQKWQALNIQNYKIEVEFDKSFFNNAKLITTVRNNTVIAFQVTPTGPQSRTWEEGFMVAGLFRRANYYINPADYLHLSPKQFQQSTLISFDATYFFPKIIDFDPSKYGVHDVQAKIEVLSFEVLPNS